MFAIVGATGHVGYSTATALRERGLPVRAIVRDETKTARLEKMGCEISIADLQDPESLARSIAAADAVQIILPVSPKAKDPAADLRQSINSLVDALGRVRPTRVLAISDYGAHVAADIGMPSIFRELEARLSRLGGHRLILRSAEHMHNWGRGITAALASGTLTTLQDPVAMPMPTISASDLGLIAADLLTRPASQHELEVIHAEGPRRYSASDVAAALGELAGRKVHAHAVPRSQWKQVLERNMPASLADLLIKANDAKNRGGLVDIEPNRGEVRHGTTGLIDALRPLVPARAPTD